MTLRAPGVRRDRRDRARRTSVRLLAIAALVAASAAVAEPLPKKTLDECIALALEHHPTIKAAGAAVDAARQRIWQAASGYLPQVNGQWSTQRRQTSIGAITGNTTTQPTPGTGQINSLQRFTYNQGSLSFSQLLFDFGQTLAAIRSAQASERSVEADRTTTRDNIVLNVQQSYYNVLATDRLLGVANETLRQTTTQLEQAQGRHDVGVAPKFDVTTAEVNVANAKLNQLAARNNLAVARETLRNALGLTGPLDFDLVDVLGTERVHLSAAEALDVAYEHRPELLSQTEQEQAQQEQITSLQRQNWPNITSGGTYNWQGRDTNLQDTWNIGASVNLSILNGGLTAAQIGEAKANLAALKYNEEALRQNIALEVRQAVLNVQQAEESIAVAEKGAQQARESLELAEGRYTTGVGNIIELTNAQVALTSAEATLVQAQYGYHAAVASLENAIGRPVGLER
jgi:outer membrane protein